MTNEKYILNKALCLDWFYCLSDSNFIYTYIGDIEIIIKESIMQEYANKRNMKLIINK